MAYSFNIAKERFNELNQSYGGFISHKDVEYIIQINEDIPKSGIKGADLAESLERRQWEVLRRFDDFKATLLMEFNMLLQNVRGQGYRIADPSEHAEIAAESFSVAVEKAGKAAMRALEYVDYGRLTQGEAARHAEVQVRLAGIQVHVKSNLPATEKYKQKRIG